MSDKSQLIEALIAAKREFLPALKTAVNPHFKSRYVDLAGATEASDEALMKYGLAILQTTEWEAGTALLITSLEHVSGEKRSGRYPLIPARDRDPQALGAAMTYARRFARMAILGMAPEDDDGTTASKKGNSEPPKAPPKAATPAPKAGAPSASATPKAAASVGSTGDDPRVALQKLALDELKWAKPRAASWLRKYFGVASTLDLDDGQAEDACALLATRIKIGEEAYRALLTEMDAEGRVLTAGSEAA